MAGLFSFSSRRAGAVITCVMAVVLTLRAFVPVGYMLMGDEDGVRLEVCNGLTGGFLWLDTETGEILHLTEGEAPPQGEAPEDPGQACPYALSSTAAFLPEMPLLFGEWSLFEGFDRPFYDDQYRPNPSRAPPPARAPPVLI